MYRFLSFLVICTLLFSAGCIDKPISPEPYSSEQRPRLVVNIVVDQMRYNFLERFANQFGEHGFKYLQNNGYSFANTHHDYFPTFTAAGHVSIFTGATPSSHGIVGNSWYDRERRRHIYALQDNSESGVGGSGSIGRRSPRNIRTTTFADELKQYNPASKVIGISLKDRAAISMTGHLGDIALWYNDDNGNFMSSTWFGKKLPEWVQVFNSDDLVEQLCEKNWNLSGQNSVAPLSNNTIQGHTCYKDIKYTPFGNTLVTELAIKALHEENLGGDSSTDILNIGFSSTDYVGHRHGPHSLEVRDTFRRLDKEIAELLAELHKEVGRENILLTLTSDHGVANVPGTKLNRHYPGGYYNNSHFLNKLRNHFKDKYGDKNWIRLYSGQQFFLNRSLIASEGLELSEVQLAGAIFLEQLDEVSTANTATNYSTQGYFSGVHYMYQRGFYPQRSGDIYIHLNPGWMSSYWSPSGTTHGSIYDYDTHVPLIFYGWNIPKGSSQEKTSITELAPTISNLLNIPHPNGTEGEMLNFN